MTTRKPSVPQIWLHNFATQLFELFGRPSTPRTSYIVLSIAMLVDARYVPLALIDTKHSHGADLYLKHDQLPWYVYMKAESPMLMLVCSGVFNASILFHCYDSISVFFSSFIAWTRQSLIL